MGLHVLMVVVVVAFLALCVWQVRRAESGNTLSYAYAFEWPIFAGYVVFMWWQLLQDELHPDRVRHRLALGRPNEDLAPGWARKEPRRTRGGQDLVVAGTALLANDWKERRPSSPEVDEEMAAYNRYLAELNARNEPKHW